MNISKLLQWKSEGLTVSDISKVSGYHPSTIRYHYNKNGIEFNNGRPSWDLTRIIDCNDYEAQYVIGFLAADGYLDKEKVIGCFIQERDISVLYRILDFFGKPYDRIRTRVTSLGSRQVGIYIGSVELVGFLAQNYGFSNTKSIDLPFPDWMTNPLPFLRGYFDGNGHIGLSCTFSTGSQSFAGGLLDWVYRTYGYLPNCQITGVNKTATNIVFRKKHEQFIRDLFSYPGLPRKTEAFLKYLPN